ncbi:MAG: terpene cyclase/mutase family protein [Kiritimatiellae bacterium]|nr:terpene cyclase/mutase family protein [Kiritimatiellia bacterium]
MENEYDQLQELMAKHNLMSLFEHLTFRQKVAKVMAGLKADKDSGDYKYARLQVARLSAPVCAILVPVLGIGMLSLLATFAPERDASVEVQVVEEIDPEALEDIEDLEDEPIEPPEPIEMEDFTPDAPPSEINDVMDAPATEVSQDQAQFEEVAMVKSPIVMRGILGNRGAGARASAMGQFGGSGVTEGAVLRALRWLKSQQQKDGSWLKTKPASTSLALLTFLAHGETPASEEFGPTVEKAIRFLVDSQDPKTGMFAGRDGHNYTHPIVTYALCEAYALTKVPMVKTAAEKALALVIKGQHPSGGWDYNLKQTTRDDTSYMGWCVQALKAAKMADLHHPKLGDAMKLAVKGMQKNAHPQGGFGYTSPGQGGLTGVGVLCMQFLGAANKPECKRGLDYMAQKASFNWREPWGRSPVYYWYYATQAKFHAGGSTWQQWNNQFSRELVRNQTVMKGAAKDGKDMGFWDSPGEKEHGDGRVMDTCLCALQLQVYYRYLPTFKTPKAIEEDDDLVSEMDEIEIDITI